jgi:hypothetical protein
MRKAPTKADSIILIVGSIYIEASAAEERLERGAACFAPIKADEEFVEVVLQVNPSLSVVKLPGPSA